MENGKVIILSILLIDFIDFKTAQMMKFSIKDFFSKCDQIPSGHIYWRNP